MIGTLAALFFAIGFLLTMASASLIDPLAEAITKCRERVKEAEDETCKIQLELEEKNEQLQLEYENKIALLKQEYETKLSENLKSLQTAEQNKNAKSEYAELCEKEMKAIESVQNIYAKYLTESTKNYLQGIVKGRLLNAFKKDFTFYLTKFDLEAKIISESKTYTTTLHNCECKSFEHSHGAACKHMIFLAYSLGVLQIYREKHKSAFDQALREGNIYSKKDNKIGKKENTSLSNENKKAVLGICGSEEFM